MRDARAASAVRSAAWSADRAAAHGVRERADVGAAGRLDDVGRDALAGAGDAAELEHDRRLAERVLAAGDGVDAELAQLRVLAGRRVDRAEDRVDRAVAGERAGRLAAVRAAGRRRSRAAGAATTPRPRTTPARTAGISSRSSSVTSASRSIAVTCFFLSAISLKRLKAVLSAWPSTSKPSSASACSQRVAAGVLAEHDRVGLEPDGRRVHDLVRRALLQHAVLVDARLVRERVAADDRLVGLHRDSRSGARRAGSCARSRS